MVDIARPIRPEDIQDPIAVAQQHRGLPCIDHFLNECRVQAEETAHLDSEALRATEKLMEAGRRMLARLFNDNILQYKTH